MNANTIARLVLVFAAGFAAVTGAEAKGSMSVGLTIVSSCAVNSANAYRAATAKTGSAAGSNATVVAGCSNDGTYTVSVSAADKAETVEAGEVRVTLTY